MKILVCAKFVPDTDHLIIKESEGGKAVIGDLSEYRMNRFDEFAVEEAVRIKEQSGGVIVDVLTVGPEPSKDVLRRAMGMGADNGIHLAVRGEQYLSPMVVAAGIADYAREKDYNLILTGAMSEDMMNGQVGPMVASFSGLPCATQVILLRLSSGRRNDQSEENPDASSDWVAVYVEREIEGGNREMLEIDLPAVIAVQTGINEPRYPSLSNLLRANKQEIETIALGGDNSVLKAPEDLVSTIVPPKMRAGRHVEGSAAEKAEQLLLILHDKALIK